MYAGNAAATALRKPGPDRRSSSRDTLVLRVGVIRDASRTSFCLVKNISADGLQVKIFGRVAVGADIMVRVGDEPEIAGRVAWTRAQLAGIAFVEPLEPEALLRAAQRLAPSRRRSSPRIDAVAGTLIRTDGRSLTATLCDVSATGARLQLRKESAVGAALTISLPDLPPMRAFRRWQHGADLGVAFETPLPIEIIARWLDGRVSLSA